MTHIIDWFEIPTRDFDKAKRFYEAVLGMHLELREKEGVRLGFFPEGESGVRGAIVHDHVLEPGAQGTVVFLSCKEALSSVLDRVVSYGGRVLRREVLVREGGTVAFFADTEGNIVGLHRDKEAK